MAMGVGLHWMAKGSLVYMMGPIAALPRSLSTMVSMGLAGHDRAVADSGNAARTSIAIRVKEGAFFRFENGVAHMYRSAP